MKSISRNTGEKIAVARVSRAHGIRGALEVAVYSGDPSGIKAAGRVFLGGDSTPRTVRRIRHRKGRFFILELEGIHDRTQAEAFKGLEVKLEREALPELGPDEYYWFELIGLSVLTTGGEELGRLAAIIETGASDVYVVRGRHGEILLPARGEVIREVDLERGRILVDPPPGLIQAE